MQGDAEYQAYLTIVKADRRFRWSAFLLLLVVLAGILCAVVFVAVSQKDLVASAQRDGRTRTEENRRYITCLLIQPLDQRDAAGQLYCFTKSDLPGGRQPSEFSPVRLEPDDAAAGATPGAIPDQ